MRLLAGNATPKKISKTGSTEKTYASQFTAAETGTISILRFFNLATTASTGIILGVYANAAEEPGALLGGKERPVKPGKEEWYEVSGFSIPVVAGTKYWFAILPVGGANSFSIREEAGTVFKSSTTGATMVETTWTTKETVGPFDFEALSEASMLAMMV